MEPTSPFEPTVLGAAWRYRWLVMAVMAAFGALGYLYGVVQSEDAEWTATATVIVEDPNASTLFEGGGLQRPERYLENQVEILRSDAVAQRAAELAAEGDPGVALATADLVDNTSVGSSSSSDVIEITHRSVDATVAQVSANAIATAYQDVRRSEAARNFAASIAQLDASIVEGEAELDNLQTQITNLLSTDSARQELESQFEDAIAELVQLQRGRRQVDEEALGVTRDRLDDVLQQLQTLQVVLAIEQQVPELTALTAAQRATIDRLSELTERRDQLEVDSELAGSGVVLYSPAIEATALGGNPRVRTLAVSLILGALAGTGLAYALALRRRRFSDHIQPELVLATPMLAEVPNFKEERIETDLPVRDAPFSAAAEAFRFVATAVALRIGPDLDRVQRSDGLGLRSIAMMSGLPDEGKSVVAANTALALAREGTNVLAIDVDFGDQRLTRLLGPARDSSPGLTEVVVGEAQLADVVVDVDKEEGGRLSLLSRGEVRTPAADLLQSESAQSFFRAVRNDYDVVILDTPPLLHVAYASTLLDYADAGIVVVPHRGNVSVLEELHDRTELVGTHVLGYVYNKAPLRRKYKGSEGSMQDVLGTGLSSSGK